MKYFVSLSLLLLFSAAASAQGGFTTTMANQPIRVFDTNNNGFVEVDGHWVGSKLLGPSASYIRCTRVQSEDGSLRWTEDGNLTFGCTEVRAAMVVSGNTFSLVPSLRFYKADHWTNTEIQASETGSICQGRAVLKIDLVGKRVFLIHKPSEPIVESVSPSIKDSCEVDQNLELMGSASSQQLGDVTLWKIQRKNK